MKRFVFLLLAPFLFSCSHGQAVDVNTFEQGLQKDIQVLDVRTAEEFDQGHIKNAMLANVNNETEFEERTAALNKSKPVYVYCLSGGRSSRAGKQLRNKGFKEVIELDGGMTAWRNADKPVENPSPAKLISDEEFNAAITSAKYVLVDFGAKWCPPCVKMEPVVKDMEEGMKTKMPLVRIDGGSQSSLMKKWKVSSMPTFVLFENGKEVWRKSGVLSKEEMLKALNQFIKN